MNKADIQQIIIEIECGGESALAMLLHRDGTLNRSGNGSLPRDGIMCMGVSDGSAFHALINSLNEAVFPHAGTFEIKDKKGIPIRYAINFLGDRDGVLAQFDFRFGLDNRDVGNLISYFDGFIQQAVTLTDGWHKETLRKQQHDRIA